MPTSSGARFLWLDHLAQDVRSSLRSLRKSPGIAAVAILSLAGGIGSSTATLAIRDTIFRNPPPLYQQPSQLAEIYTVTPRGFRRHVPAGLFEIWTKEQRADQTWAAAKDSRRDDVRMADRNNTVPVQAVSANFFSVLGVPAAFGRTFADSAGNQSTDAVLSDRAWQILFDRRPDAVGQTFWIAERAYTVIGVMPDRFWFLELDTFVWTALDVSALPPGDGLTVVVRRPSGISAPALKESLTTGLGEYTQTLPEADRSLRANVAAIGGTPMGRQVSLFLPYLLGGCVVMTWLIACANVAILMIAKWTSRERETAVRAALGASRSRIVRLLLTESMLVAIGGGVLGVCATFALRALILHNLTGPAVFDTSINPSVLLQSVALTGLTGLLAGFAPALYETRRLHVNPLRAMGSERIRQRWRHALVIAEITATVGLLVVTGAFIDGYRRQMAADLGFPTRALLVVRVENPAGVRHAEILELLNGMPDITSAAAGTSSPFGGLAEFHPVTLDGAEGSGVPAESVQVSPTFFSTLDVPMRAGRAFSREEASTGATVAIVNETLAARLIPGRTPIGARIWVDRRAYDVVGVVSDYLSYPLSHPAPAVFTPLSLASYDATSLRFVLRASTTPGPLIAGLRRDVPRVGTGHAVTSAFAVDENIALGAQEMLMGTVPLMPLIIIGLLLTASGVYAVLAFAVARRAKEFALRIAIGASRGDVVRLVTVQSVRLVAIGSVLGVALTFALTRVVRAWGGAGSMFDTPSWPAFLIPALIIFGVGALATWVPSRRALRTEPAVLLRVD